jgi:hypothetical protein
MQGGAKTASPVSASKRGHTTLSDFELSRIYAQGWRAAKALTFDECESLSPAEAARLNPHKREPARARWQQGFAGALQRLSSGSQPATAENGKDPSNENAGSLRKENPPALDAPDHQRNAGAR